MVENQICVIGILKLSPRSNLLCLFSTGMSNQVLIVTKSSFRPLADLMIFSTTENGDVSPANNFRLNAKSTDKSLMCISILKHWSLCNYRFSCGPWSRHKRGLIQNLFLKISQYSQENTCAGVSHFEAYLWTATYVVLFSNNYVPFLQYLLFAMFIYFYKITFERLQLSTTFKDKILFSHISVKIFQM